MNTPHQYVRRRGAPGRTKIIVLACIGLGLIVVNIATALVFHGRTYPGTDAGGKQVGSIAYADLAAKVSNNYFLPGNITITYKRVDV
jgi:hypothetical protein